MFDTIGRMVDPEAGRRRTTSLLLTSLLAGATLGASLWAGLGAAPPTVVPEPDPPMIFTDFEPEEPEPLEAPEPPAPGGGGQGQHHAADAPPPQEPTDAEPPPLQDEVPEAQVPTAEHEGRGDGEGPGDGDGLGEGPGGPGACTSGDCGSGLGYRVFSHHELKVRRRAEISYPFGIGDQGRVRCTADVYIDERGRPTHVDVTKCPEDFHHNTTVGLLRWRWQPPTDDLERPVHARTRIVVVYDPR